MGESRITPSGIINDAVSMIGKMNDSSFPIDVFPNKIRNIILNMYEYLAFPIDYTACSMMTAISTCIGNTHILHFKTGWDIKCIIYMALVGRPGANKSHPLKTAFEPLFRFDKEQKEIYNEEYRKYESIMSLSKKERLEQGFDMFPKEPVRTRFLVSDITQEAMAKSISENPRGICLYMDELQGWINNFTRYNKGSEEQFYISLFNGYMYISDRKMNTNNIMIDSPFSNVIGTIQPEILIDTFKGSKSNNGFLDRILFAIPEIQDKLYWKDDDIDMSHFNEWNTIMQSFISMKIEHDEYGNINPTRLEYEPGARRKIIEGNGKEGKVHEDLILSKMAETFVIHIVFHLSEHGFRFYASLSSVFQPFLGAELLFGFLPVFSEPVIQFYRPVSFCFKTTAS